MELSLPKRRKLALLFLLGVALPSLALCLLALRGIQNELALLEQRQLDGYRALADEIGDSVLTRIGQAERSLARSVVRLGDPSLTDPIPVLDSLEARHPIVDVAFFLEGDGTIRVPSTTLLFRADGELGIPEAPAWPPRLAEEMRSGQEREFRRDLPAAALLHYRRAFDATPDSMLKAQALLAMTRVQRKAGRFEGALADCEELLRSYGTIRTAEGMPLGPVASLERGAMLLSLGDSLGALEGFVDLYARLAAGAWELERAQHDFLAAQSSSAAGALSAVLHGPAADSLSRALAALGAEVAVRRERARRILLFRERSGEDLLARLAPDPGGIGDGSPRFSVDDGGRSFLVSLLDPSPSESGVWGLLLDDDYVRDTLVRPALEGGLDDGSVDWIVRGRHGGAILAGPPSPAHASPAGSPALTASFAGNFPPWLVELRPLPRSPYRLLLTSGQSVYLYMFLAIAMILGFGLVLTVRTVTRELELARMKSDFVSTVSHEFKSPLTSIHQVAEMLQRGRVPSEERRRRYYDVLLEQSSRLASLVTNVLDLARIEEGRELHPETVDLEALVQGVVDATRHRVGHEGFRITSLMGEPRPCVRADPDALGQAVSNLLDNAIRYSGEARDVQVTVGTDNGSAIVTVEDHGVGIPREEIGRVFDRFYRGRGELPRSIRGSGLGLALVKEIVEAHGGSVDATSEVGEGSTFRIKLPAHREQHHA
jgi:signal transduction histidine kinase